jgi:NAD(P)-dependent dehydrogenase (short-subunit alcohol dehydrogenase family)
VLTIAGDIADPATAEQLVTGAVERFGRVDTLINNAGGFIAKPFTQYTATDYEPEFDDVAINPESCAGLPCTSRGSTMTTSSPLRDLLRQSPVGRGRPSYRPGFRRPPRALSRS